jgi:hypothetical protein
MTWIALPLTIWWPCTLYLLAVDPESVPATDIPFQLALFAVFAGVGSAWVSAHALGLVGGGSGAGFGLAALGLAARIECELVLTMFGFESGHSVYDWEKVIGWNAPLGAMVWLVRNGSLIAYGCGLALVLLASGADIVRRRRTPDWARPVD